MPSFAIMADVHSNLEALQAVLSEIRGEEAFCLGDTVGYGANPNEVIDLLKENGVRAVMGNHDNAALTGATSGFNATAAMAAEWTRKQLTDSSFEFLRALPLSMSFDSKGLKVHLTHGSPDEPLWEYVDPWTHSQLLDHYLEKLGAEVLALGHTHVPYVWSSELGIVFNPGSVGQPRDGDRRAAFARLAIDGGVPKVEERRVEYDCEKAANKIRAAGLPEQLATRLLIGR